RVRPAPFSRSAGACSNTTTAMPARRMARAVVSPPIPPPMISAFMDPSAGPSENVNPAEGATLWVTERVATVQQRKVVRDEHVARYPGMGVAEGRIAQQRVHLPQELALLFGGDAFDLQTYRVQVFDRLREA